ncbi:MAG: hypothetical protein HY986_09575 [Candidatus Melainabacteria bacterium]|nr:hypothetical protein [Candidatus Melainabacteria bacterium]
MLSDSLTTGLIAVGLIILVIIAYHDEKRRTQRRRHNQLVLAETISIQKHLSLYVIPALEAAVVSLRCALQECVEPASADYSVLDQA